MEKLATNLQEVESHHSPKRTKGIVRHARRTAEDVAFHHRVRRIAALEKEARKWIARSITLIARGRAANIQLGRIFIKLKRLVGHGNFESYYVKKFERDYGIAFRTAQDYMRLARDADEAKSAAPALFPPATDPQAVETREATARHQAAVARARSSSSETASSDAETDHGERAKDHEGSMCTCRLQIRMSKEDHARVLALWRSDHRALAESAVTKFLLELCAKYGIDGNTSEGSDE